MIYASFTQIEIVKIHFKYGRNFGDSSQSFAKIPMCKTPVRSRIARTTKNIASVAKSVKENIGLSISRHSHKLGISKTSLHKDLGMHAYKVQLIQELKPADHEQCCTFANWELEMQANDFFKKIILSDEAHFHLNGYDNKQNFIWDPKTQPLSRNLSIQNGSQFDAVFGPVFSSSCIFSKTIKVL